jgi:hypothetical protein
MPSAGSKTAGGAAAPRYEFRVWAASLAAVRKRLEKFSGPQPAKQSRETYIVSDATNDTNTKIRAGAMDIKVLVRINQNLEQWNPYLKADFPIDAALIAEKIFPALHVDPPELRRQLFTAEVFVDTVVKPHPRLAAVELGKVRRHYVFGGCAAEFVEVEIGGSVLHSVAVESTNPHAVLDAIGELDIGNYANTSYVTQIKSTLGRGRRTRANPPADVDRAMAAPLRRPRRAR